MVAHEVLGHLWSVKSHLEWWLSCGFYLFAERSLTLAEWWELDDDIASFIIDADAFQKCVGVEDRRSEDETELRDLVTASALGKSAYE